MSEGTETPIQAPQETAFGVGFEKVVGVGMLIILAGLLAFSYLALSLGMATDKTLDFVLAFYKDIGLILVGALANSVRHKNEGK